MEPVAMDTLLAKLNAARELMDRGVAPAKPAGKGGVDFSAVLKSSLDQVDRGQVQANTLAERFQLGDPKVSLEETMVAVQKASLSFQQMVQIRNRVIAAYHDIMNMQV
jgi:flagellar hook-basal body complex protein FliE